MIRQSPAARSTDLAIGPRVVVLPGGEAVCSFMFTARTATNEFAPALGRSTDHGATWGEPRLVWPHLRSRWSLFVSVSRDVYWGRLLGTCWRVPDDGPDLPDAYALSRDGWNTWTPTASTGTTGQTTALAPTPDGAALFLYNQRRHGEPGLRRALARPTETSFGIEGDDYLWRAQTRTQSDSSGGLNEWGDSSFGEPAIARCPRRGGSHRQARSR